MIGDEQDGIPPYYLQLDIPLAQNEDQSQGTCL